MIDQDVQLGPGCVVGPHVYITGVTTIGANNRFYAGCVIGEAPQDLRYAGEPTRTSIGDGNVFREHVTIHRSSKASEETRIGSHNFLMANAHVGHNSVLGDRVIIANGALLGGYASVADRAFISGNCLVHQFTRVGSLSLMQGGAAISKDLAPFTIARGVNRACGLNIVGMRRAGLSADERVELKRLYTAIFRSGTNVRAAAVEARQRFSSPPAKVLLDFIAESKRGVCAHVMGAGDSEE